jgi:hypothetical protein
MQSILSKLTSDTRLLIPTKRHLRMELVHAVNPHGARLELMRRLDRAVQVRAEHGSGETVHRIVSLANDVYT